jgi:hypothetical protein
MIRGAWGLGLAISVVLAGCGSGTGISGITFTGSDQSPQYVAAGTYTVTITGSTCVPGATGAFGMSAEAPNAPSLDIESQHQVVVPTSTTYLMVEVPGPNAPASTPIDGCSKDWTVMLAMGGGVIVTPT